MYIALNISLVVFHGNMSHKSIMFFQFRDSSFIGSTHDVYCECFDKQYEIIIVSSIATSFFGKRLSCSCLKMLCKLQHVIGSRLYRYNVHCVDHHYYNYSLLITLLKPSRCLACHGWDSRMIHDFGLILIEYSRILAMSHITPLKAPSNIMLQCNNSLLE